MVFISGCIVSALVAYVLLCAFLRYRQMHTMEARFQTSRGAMTLLQAYEIQKWLGEQEFPATFSASIFFALFKVGIRLPPARRPPQLTKADVRRPVNLPAPRGDRPDRRLRHPPSGDNLKARSRHERAADQHGHRPARLPTGHPGRRTHPVPPRRIPKARTDL